MTTNDVRATRRAAAALAVALLCACSGEAWDFEPGPDLDDLGLSPLQGYNDRWEGGMAFDDGTSIPATMAVFVTPLDEAGEDSDLFKRIYASISVTRPELDMPLAAQGEANHWDTRDLSQSLFQAIPDRQFIEVTIQDDVLGPDDEWGGERYAEALEGDDEPTLGSERYRAAYASFLEALGTAAELVPDPDHELVLIAENHGCLLEGIIAVRDFSPAHLHDRQIGTISMRRRDPSVPVEVVSDGWIRSEPFEFRTQPLDAQTTMFEVRELPPE